MRQVPEDRHFAAPNGVETFYRHWPPAHGKARGAILLFESGEERGPRLADLVDKLDLSEFALYAWKGRDLASSVSASARHVQTFVQHPQLEMIARALTSHRQGRAWVMRRRTQEEMDQLASAAGFRKLEQRIDDFGIFTVSLAIRERAPAGASRRS